VEQNKISTSLAPIIPTLTALMSGRCYGDGEYLKQMVMQEIENLNYIALTNPKILECHPETIKYAMRKVISQGLSFDPDAGLIYLTTRNIKGKDGAPDFLKLEATPTVNGEISQYRMAGSLYGIESPEVVTDANGYVQSVSVMLIVPTINGGTREMNFEFGVDFFKNLEKASHRQNSFGKKPNEINNSTLNWANPNYSNYYPDRASSVHSYDDKGGIQPAFAITKAIKHALKRSKLDKNQYGNRIKDITHLKVVDPKFDEPEVTIDTTYEPVFNFEEKSATVEDKKPEPKKEEPKKEEKKEEPKKENPKKSEEPVKNGSRQDEIMELCNAAKSKSEVEEIYNKNKADVEPDTFTKIKALFKHWKKIESEVKSEEVSSSDL
jgi:hypothetical protein